MNKIEHIGIAVKNLEFSNLYFEAGDAAGASALAIV